MSHRTRISIAFVLLLLIPTVTRTVDWQWPLPEWAATALVNAGIELTSTPSARYTFARHVNPAVLFGDFDGDHRTDAAILVRQSKTSKVGIAVALRQGRVDVVGAGAAFGNGGDDFDWLDHWFTYTRDPVARGAGEGDPPALAGDAIFVEKSESASAIIYFIGSEYAWYQQGD